MEKIKTILDYSLVGSLTVGKAILGVALGLIVYPFIRKQIK